MRETKEIATTATLQSIRAARKSAGMRLMNIVIDTKKERMLRKNAVVKYPDFL